MKQTFQGRFYISRYLLFIFCLALFSLGCSQTTPPSKSRSGPPNVIIILTDDQGAVDLGAYGTKDIQTPNMDRIAEKGIKFTQFYAGAPICSPSRAALMTGKTPIRAGVPGNIASIPNQKKGLQAEEITIAEMLKEEDYKTAAIGKWHLGYSAELQPTGQGFDYFFGHLVGCIDNFSHFYFWRGPNRHDLYRNGKEVHYPGQYFPELCLKEASQFIDENKEHPFFIYYAMNTPHYPYQGSPEWLDYYEKEGIPYPRNIYNAFVSTMDEYIGKLLDKIDETGLSDHTIIIFQSDHGHSTEERAHFGGGSSGPYRGAKGSLLEGGIRVPAMISWPGKITQGESRNQLSVTSDWLPTIAELCGISAPTHKIDGKSLMPIIQSSESPDNHEIFHWAYGHRWAVRKGNWKLLFDPLDTSKKRKADPASEEDKWFLVDIENDPGEKNNLAKTNPEIVETLKGIHEEWVKNDE